MVFSVEIRVRPLRILSLKTYAKQFMCQNYGCFENSKVLTLEDLQSTGWAKNGTIFVRLITSPNINRFPKFFHFRIRKQFAIKLSL